MKYRIKKAYRLLIRLRIKVTGIRTIKLATSTARELNLLLYSIEVSWPMTLPIVKKVKTRLKSPALMPVDALISKRIGLKVRKNSGKINIEK